MLTSPRRRSVDHGAIVVRRVLRPRMMLSAAAVAMATIGVVAAATLGGRGPTGIPRSSTASPVAAISPYRLSCLGVAMALHGPRFSRGGFDQRVCGDAGRARANCRRWPAASTIGYLGPVRSTVPAIQAELSVCA
jgi:hypothetical protein